LADFLPLTPDLYSCQSMSIERGGAEEAPSTKHRAPTRTIADSEETCINLATLSSRPERSAPLSRSPAASNTEDPEREIPGPPARPARTPAHRASRRTPARAAGLTPAAPPPRPSAMRHGPTRRSVLRTGRPAAATRRRGPWDPGRAGASGPAVRPAARTAARTQPRTVGAASRRRTPSRTSRPRLFFLLFVAIEKKKNKG
jgi:hypothetical protein